MPMPLSALTAGAGESAPAAADPATAKNNPRTTIKTANAVSRRRSITIELVLLPRAQGGADTDRNPLDAAASETFQSRCRTVAPGLFRRVQQRGRRACD